MAEHRSDDDQTGALGRDAVEARQLLGVPALIVTDAEGVVQLWSPEAEALYGWGAAEAIGRPIFELPVHPDDVDLAAQIMARVTSGLSWEGSFPVRRADGSRLLVHVRDTPLLGPDGAVTGVAGLSWPEQAARSDDAATVQATATDGQRRQALLARVGSLLESSLDYQDALQRLAELCVPALGDNCLVDVVDEVDGMPTGRRSAMACTDVDRLGQLHELRRRYPPRLDRPNPAIRVTASGRGEVFDRFTDQTWASMVQDDEHLALLRSLGLKTAMVAPLQARGRVFGAISVGVIESGRTFGDAELALLEELGVRAGLALDNARVYSELALVARRLQEALLPPNLPTVPGLEIGARYLASGDIAVGGDFFDVFATGDGAWAAAVGDVCGKGAEAAAVTGLVRHTLRAVTLHERAPRGVLAALNATLLADERIDSFCTVAYLRLVPVPTGTQIVVACGGHPLPMVLRADGGVEDVGRAGTLLGVLPTVDCPEVTTVLAPGDAVVLYTDGVTERREGLRFLGDDGLREVLSANRGATADDLAAAVQEAVADFQRDAPRDDLAVLVLRATGSPALTSS